MVCHIIILVELQSLFGYIKWSISLILCNKIYARVAQYYNLKLRQHSAKHSQGNEPGKSCQPFHDNLKVSKGYNIEDF